jgi:hydrogenase-4 component B
VLYRTGERDMNRLGGLASSMPYTAGSTAIASLSIAGVPPFNGFASKWLIIAGCLLAGMHFPLFLVLGLVALFISLATLAMYLKVLGAVFLGLADENRRVPEVPVAMIVPQVVLAGLCVLLGIFPQVVLRFIGHAIAPITGMQGAGVDASRTWGGISLIAGSAVGYWSPFAILTALVILTLIAYGIERAGGAGVRTVPVWYGGEEHNSALVRYPASSFYLPFVQAFQGIYPSGRVHPPKFPTPLRRALDFDRWLYMPGVKAVERTADRVSRTQVGIPQIYLLWIVVGAVIVTGIMLWIKG